MSIQIRNKLDQNQPTHVYYDLQMINNSTGSPSQQPIAFSYIDTRNNPLLMTPSQYFLSVVRFQVQTGNLPIFIPALNLNQTPPVNVNQTAYSITLNYKTYNYQQYINYVNYDLTETAPTALNINTITSQYYYIFSYQQWCQMINTAFQSAFTALNALVVAGGDTLPTTYAPFVQFDPYSLIMNINGDVLGYAQSLTYPINIYFNSPLYSLYSNFPFTFYGYNVSLGKNFLLTMVNNSFSNIYVVPTTPTYNAIQAYQEGSTASLLNPVQSIVFTTGLLPVVQENVGIPSIVTATGLNNSNGNNANVSPIITDFQVPLSAINRYLPDIQYTPNGEYRLVDLYGDSPISRIEVSVFWKDVYGVLHPLLLGAGASASMKIMFRKKNYGNINLYE